MHKKLILAVLVSVALVQAPQLVDAQSVGQNTRVQSGQAKPQRVKKPATKPAAPQLQATEESRQQLLLNSDVGVSLESLKTTLTELSVDPVQLAIGAVLALFIRSVLVRMWHLFLGILRFLFARRRRAAALPVQQIQYVAVPAPQQAPAPPAPPTLVVAPA